MTTKAPAALKLITSLAELNKAIVSIGNRGKKLDSDIQHAALSCLDMIDKHGNIGPLVALYFAMPKGSRTNALLDWAQTFGKVTVNTGDDFKIKPFLFNREGKTDLAGGVEKPWYEFKLPPPANVEFSLKAALAVLLKKAEAQTDKPDMKLDEDHAEVLAKLKALAA